MPVVASSTLASVRARATITPDRSTPRCSFFQPRLPRPPCFTAAHSPSPTIERPVLSTMRCRPTPAGPRRSVRSRCWPRPGERGVIGRGQSETQHPEDRRQEAFSLPQGQVEDEPERQRGFDGEIGLPLPATFADPHGLPSGDRIRGQPHGDIASLDQCSVVCRPISDVVFCLVLRVHSRLHVEIIHLPSLRWPGGRSWRTEGAGSVHQRVCRESPVKGDKMP